MWSIVLRIWPFIIKYQKYLLYVLQIILYFVKLKKEKPMNPNVELLIDKLVKLIDDHTNTGAFLDPIDQYAFKAILKSCWRIVESKASESMIVEFNNFAASIVTKDDDALIAHLTELINTKIDIPGIGEETEAEIIKATLTTVAVVLRSLLSK